MYNPFDQNRKECRAVREYLEDRSSVPPALHPLSAHMASCAACQAAAEDFLLSQSLLQPFSPAEPSTWFVPRVMAAIAAHEEKLSRTLEIWRAVPKLAARLTWVTAITLLVASAWLIEKPRPVIEPSVASIEESAESVFGLSPRPAPPVTNDDVLVSLVEH